MGCMVDTWGEVRNTIYTRFGVKGASLQGYFYMSWTYWEAVKWHIYMDFHDVNYPLWQFCVCAVVMWKLFGEMAMTFTGTESWLVLLLSLTDGLGVVKSVSLEFFSSWYKLFLSVTLAWCLRALLWARAACKDVDGSLWKFFLVEFLACDILVIVSSLLLDLLLLFSYVLASFCFSTPCLVRCETSADTSNSSASITDSRWWQKLP